MFAQELNLSVFIQIVFHLSCICELHFECTTIACVEQNYFHFYVSSKHKYRAQCKKRKRIQLNTIECEYFHAIRHSLSPQEAATRRPIKPLIPSTGCPIERPMGLRRLLPKRLADAEALTPWHEIGCDVKCMIAVGYHLILLGFFNSFGKRLERLS